MCSLCGLCVPCAVNCPRCEQHLLFTGTDVFDLDQLAKTLHSAMKSPGGDAGVQTALFEVLGSIEGAGACTPPSLFRLRT